MRRRLRVLLEDDPCLDHSWTVEPGPYGQAQSAVGDSDPEVGQRYGQDGSLSFRPGNVDFHVIDRGIEDALRVRL